MKLCFESESAFVWVVFRIQESQNSAKNENIPCFEELYVPPEAWESSPEVNKKKLLSRKLFVLKGTVARDVF
jgi:hypothetical protein